MPWKLVVTSNSNSEIRTSEIGYTKRRKSDAVNNTIKVLQIQPDQYCTWDLTKDENFKALFNAVKQDFVLKLMLLLYQNMRRTIKIILHI